MYSERFCLATSHLAYQRLASQSDLFGSLRKLTERAEAGPCTRTFAPKKIRVRVDWALRLSVNVPLLVLLGRPDHQCATFVVDLGVKRQLSILMSMLFSLFVVLLLKP